MAVDDTALHAILEEHPLASHRGDFAPPQAAALSVFRGIEVCAALVAR